MNHAKVVMQALFGSRASRVGVVGAALAVTAAIGYAAIPDGSGVIHACYSTRDGTVRVIDSPAQVCGRNETALAWNQTGPAGPPGSAGTSPVLGYCRVLVGPAWSESYEPSICTVTFTLDADATVLVDFGAFLDSPDGFGYVTPQVDAEPADDVDSAVVVNGDASVAGMVPKTLTGPGTHTITLDVRKTNSIAGGASFLWMKVTRI